MESISAEPATVAVFGGSGATGTALISHALRHGLGVRALERTTGSIDPGRVRLEVLEGSLNRADDVRATLQGCRAAICVFGPHPPYTDIFCEQATATIVAAMHELGIRRLVCQTGGMVGDYPANRTLAFRLMADVFARRCPDVAYDRRGQEHAVMLSDLDWTLVKPPRISEVAAKGRWTAGPDVRVGMLSAIARDDLAEFLLAEALTPQYLGQAVFIRN